MLDDWTIIVLEDHDYVALCLLDDFARWLHTGRMDVLQQSRRRPFVAITRGMLDDWTIIVLEDHDYVALCLLDDFARWLHTGRMDVLQQSRRRPFVATDGEQRVCCVRCGDQVEGPDDAPGSEWRCRCGATRFRRGEDGDCSLLVDVAAAIPPSSDA